MNVTRKDLITQNFGTGFDTKNSRTYMNARIRKLLNDRMAREGLIHMLLNDRARIREHNTNLFHENIQTNFNSAQSFICL